MSAIPYPIRLAAAVAALEEMYAAHDEAAHYDAGFDAGEFSGPAHGQMVAREEVEIAARYRIPFADAYAVIMQRANADPADAFRDQMIRDLPGSFAAFQAGRAWCEDIERHFFGESLGKPSQGWTYCDGVLFIAKDDGDKWLLIIANCQWLEADLAKLEARLFEYAIAEGMIE